MAIQVNPAFLQTPTLLFAYEELPPNTSFARDRYFPGARPLSTEEVLVEMNGASQTLAPAVPENSEGVQIGRLGWTARTYRPPFFKPKRVHNASDLKRKGFGESLGSDLPVEQRQAALINDDMVYLRNILARREEWMAWQVLQHNGYTLTAKTEDGGPTQTLTYAFYEGSNDPSTLTIAAADEWTDTTDWKTIAGHVLTAQSTLRRRGLPGVDLIVGANVAEVLNHHEGLLKRLDQRNNNTGALDPSIDASLLGTVGRINFGAGLVNTFTFDGTYTDEAGVSHSFVDPDTIILAAPNLGETAYGLLTWMDDAGVIHEASTDALPAAYTDKRGKSMELSMESRPLVIPSAPSPFVHAKVVNI